MLALPGIARWRRAVVALSLCAACGEPTGTREALESAESTWLDHPVESYAIEVSVTKSGEAIRRVRVEVRSGDVVEAFLDENGAERRIEGDQARAYTVEGLFRTVHEELAANQRRSVGVSFDSEHGFPDRIELGPLRDAPDESTWVIRVDSFRATTSAGE